VRRTLYGLAALVVIGVIVILVAPLFISAENVRNTLFDQVESATGYRIRVAGDVDISVFPSLDLVAEGVAVSRRIGEDYQDVAQANELRFGLALTALLGGKVRMTEIALIDPVITVPEGDETAADTTTSAESQPAGSPASTLRSLSLDRLVIENGTILLPGGDQTVSNVDLTASLADFDAPLSLDLKAVFDGQPVALKGSVERFGPFLEGEVAPVSLTVAYPAVLAQEVSFTANALYSGESFALEQFQATAGESAFGGELRADLSSDISDIHVTLSGETLDLDALLNQEATSRQEVAEPSAPGGDAANTPIDFSALNTMSAYVDVSLSKVVVSGIAIAPLVANIQTGGGKADMIADLIGVGSATGSASLSVDANQDAPYVSGKLRITGVDLAEASRLAGSDFPVTGTAGADVVFATAGNTPAELQARINASGSLSLQDGSATVEGLSGVVGDKGADRITGITVTAQFADLIQPLTVNGSAAWHGERFDIAATADVRGILSGQSSGVQAKATSKRVSAGFDGQVTAAGAANGRVSLATPSLTQLMVWLGQQPAWDSGFEAFSVDGRLTVSPDAIAFADTKIRLDDTEGSGSGQVTLGAKPSVQAKLVLETLNVNPYLGASAQKPAGQAPAASAGWDTAKIDFSALNAIDADLALSVKKLIYRDIKAGPVAISAKVAGGKLDAKLSDLKLYKGVGAGALSVDASGQVPTQAFQFSLEKLDAYPFLRDAAGFGRIEGTANITIDLTASGESQQQIVSGLNGSSTFEFANGAIRGINVAKMARNLTSGVLSGWSGGDNEKTDFASLGASFAIQQGQAKTDDLHLVGPLVRMTGSGTVDMPAQTLSFKVDPKVVASLEGQGSAKDMEGLGVPVIVSGPWASPKIYPDIAGILQDPQAAYQQLQKLGGGLFNLPGGGDLGGAGGIADAVKDKTGVDIGDLLKDGKIDQDALKDGALKGLGNLLGGSPSDGGGAATTGGGKPAGDGKATSGKADKKGGGKGDGGKKDKKSDKAADGPADAKPAPAKNAKQAPAPSDAKKDKKDKKGGKDPNTGGDKDKSGKGKKGKNKDAKAKADDPEAAAKKMLEKLLTQ
jgi:AsmA protein